MDSVSAGRLPHLVGLELGEVALVCLDGLLVLALQKLKLRLPLLGRRLQLAELSAVRCCHRFDLVISFRPHRLEHLVVLRWREVRRLNRGEARLVSLHAPRRVLQLLLESLQLVRVRRLDFRHCASVRLQRVRMRRLQLGHLAGVRRVKVGQVRLERVRVGRLQLGHLASVRRLHFGQRASVGLERVRV